MSTEDFNRKIDEFRKLNSALNKDLNYRVQLQKQKKPVFELDAEIRGSIRQLEQLEFDITNIYNNFKANPKDFGFTNKQLQKRGDAVNSCRMDLAQSKNKYDSFFLIKKDEGSKQAQRTAKYENMNKAELIQNKQKQEKNQQQILDELINTVKNTKEGNKDIGEVLDEQDKQLNELGEIMDLNMHKMGTVKRGMMKLLDGSSNACLVLANLLLVVSLICILIFW